MNRIFRMSRYVTFIVFFLFALGFAVAQPSNDNCISAIHIPNIDNYCSADGQFTNFNASGTTGLTNTCLTDFSSEVWFTFIPQTTAAIIQVFGAVNNQGSLTSPVITIFDGCTTLNQVGCNSASLGINISEVVVGDLIIGKVYYIAVDGQFDSQGTFKMCIDGFNPPPSPESDCVDAVVLCDKSPFFIESLVGSGSNRNEIEQGSCIQEEFASSWYTWTCETAGSLAFTLTPTNYIEGFESDDLDFAVYELPGGINNCTNKMVLRCMASGANQSEPFSNWAVCNGPTGLSLASTDLVEQPGCQPGNDNFVAPIEMEAGKSYALIVNNFSQSGLGFAIEFGGTGTFLGPNPNFDILNVQAFECDKTIVFTDLSEALTDSIVSYRWNFGVGAVPLNANTPGPHDVIYESFGDKRVALTVESSRGCIVTEILDIYVEPCCADTSTLDLDVNTRDQICPETASGLINGIGINGSPEYMFSLDGVNYQPSPTFPGLLPADYQLFIQDQKGCVDSIDADILEADIFAVEAGDTIFVDLGEVVEINAVPIPNILPSTVVWTGADSLTFLSLQIADLFNPQFLPCSTSTLTITIANELGCSASDSIVVLVNIIRPIFIPNAISANNDQINDWAMVFGGSAIKEVELFQVYNRWGGLVHEAKNFQASEGRIDDENGWNGRVQNNGEFVAPGVYTYIALVQFLDKVTIPYHGTITVLK